MKSPGARRVWSADLATLPPAPRVLLMKWSALGDLALATAAIEDVFRALPGAHLDLDTPPRFAPLFAHDPRFRQVLGIDVRSAWLGGMARWLARVAAARYDLIIDMQSTDRSRLLIGVLVAAGRGPRIRVGNHRRWPYTAAPPAQPRHTHALEHLRAALASCAIPVGTDHPILHPGPEHHAHAQALLEEHGLVRGRFALFMPGCQRAGWLKRWGWRRFATLALSLAKHGIENVLLVGAEDEREECDAIATACPEVAVNACGKTALLDLVPLAQAAACVVANDTGTAHVASAAARPTVVVCGPTDPRRVRPAGTRVRALQAELWCRSCYRKDCTHHSCMDVLSPEQVLDALASLGALGAHGVPAVTATRGAP